MSKIYCVGDIHGCLDKLNNLLDKLNIQPNDTVVTLGDYVDRGPDSYGVIERLLKLRTQCNCIFITGNHDALFFDDDKFRSDIEPKYRYTMWNQGARETYNSYIKAGVTPEVHYDFYKLLESYYVLELNGEKHLFVHGGYNRHKLLEDQKNNLDTFLWDRDLLGAAIANYNRTVPEDYPFKNKDGFKHIYVGHTPVTHWGFHKPMLFQNVWAMDTGVGKYDDAILFALEITTQTLIS